jgi:hypothetical protein
LSTTSTDTHSPDDNNAALIGGIVGGVVAMLVVGGLIAFLVARSRRRSKDGPNSGVALQSVRQSVSKNEIHDASAVSHGSNYGVLVLSQPANVGSHDNDVTLAWSSKDDNCAKPLQNHTEYEDFTQVH